MRVKKQPDWEPEYDYVERWELLLADMLTGMQKCDISYDERYNKILELSEELRKL